MTGWKLTRAEDALFTFTCNASSIISGLLNIGNEYEHDRFTDDDRDNFDHFRFCVLNTLQKHADIALDEFHQYRKENK